MNDLETRLSAASRSLRERAERTADLDAGWTDLTARLAADGDGAVVVQPGDRFDRPPVQRHRWLAAAAAILVIIGAAATFVALTDHANEPTAAGGPLFLLPEPGSGYEVSDGYVEDVDPELVASRTPPVESVAFGVPEGDGYRDSLVMTLNPGELPSAADMPPEFERRVVETESGPVFVVSQGSHFQQVVQQRDGVWIGIQVMRWTQDDQDTTEKVDLAVQLITATEVVDGSMVVQQSPGGLAEIARERGPRYPVAPSIAYQVSGQGIVAGDDGTLASVDSVDWPTSIVLLAASSASFLEPFTVDGHDGWHVTRADGWQGLAWRADSGQMVAVSGDEDLEKLMRLAESLVPVDETTWRLATGAGPAPATTTTSQP